MNEDKLFEILKGSKDYISGEEISRQMDVSRTSVWKYINKLRAKGCKILSSTNRGYKLEDEKDLIVREDLQKTCHTSMIGRKIVYYGNCTSTNEMARLGELTDDEEGSVYITDMQTGGKGRMGRTWHFEANKAVAMSILLKPVISPAHMMPISLIAGLSVALAIEDETGLECFLKWPNDIICNNKKIAGILIESATEGEYTRFIILGIGINCNIKQFPPQLSETATSILIESDEKVSRKSIICRTLEKFEKMYFEWINEYDETSDFENESSDIFSYTGLYKAKCINIGREILVRKMDREFKAIAQDVDPLGNLLITNLQGEKIPLSSGEVSVRGENGYV
jgi:BirA family biotin operon repressor/biotin-[acetyl-CoA-carboxylase] ligase